MDTPRGTTTDATTQGEALASFESEGFTGQFGARDGGLVLCFTCRAESPADSVPLHGLIRTEGVSDPAEMTAIAALECPACGVKGTVLLMYGPEAPLSDSEVLRDLEDDRGPTGVSTGETSRTS